VLGAGGVLKGRRATTHRAWQDFLGSITTQGRVPRGRNLFTAGGITAGRSTSASR
jgi:transcriptional regulator GlxA family with amidase domain